MTQTKEESMDPGTGHFHNLADEERRKLLAKNLGVLEGELDKKIKDMGWMELSAGEIVKLKGHDFEVLAIGKTVIVLESVKVIDWSQEPMTQPTEPKSEREQ